MTKRKQTQTAAISHSGEALPATANPRPLRSDNHTEAKSSANASAPRIHSKTARLLTLLLTDTGASLGEMCEATGWQAHSVRAALTGLRKRGHAIERVAKDDNVESPGKDVAEGAATRWRIVAPPPLDAKASA